MIRSATPGDTEAIVVAWRSASRVGHPFLDESFLTAEEARLRDVWLPSATTFVAESDGDVVGFLSLVGSTVGGLFVHADHQRRGVGAALLDHAATVASRLRLEVFEANTGGVAFYQACGFRPIGHSVDPDTGLVQVVMARG